MAQSLKNLALVSIAAVGLLLGSGHVVADGKKHVLASTVLPTTGKTIAGPGSFRGQAEEIINVVSFWERPETNGMCITVACQRGTCLSYSGFQLPGPAEPNIAEAGETGTLCFAGAARIDVKCGNSKCSGFWRVDTY